MTQDLVASDDAIEECIEALEDLVISLAHLPPLALAQAMGTHLEGLLGALVAAGGCMPGEIRSFLSEIGRGALGEAD